MNKILATALGFLATRSPRLRKFAPAVPLLLAAYELWKRHKSNQAAAAAAPARV